MTLENKISLLKSKYLNIDIDRQIQAWKQKNPSINIETLIDQGLSSSFPFYVIRVGYSCNVQCIHCFVEDKRAAGDLTFEQLQAVVDTIPNASSVIITGGEPTLRNDLIQLLKYIETGHTRLINIQSNGLRFESIEYLKEIEPYFDSILLPIHSSDSKIFDTVSRVPGSAEKVFRAFKNFADSTILITTQTVLNQANYSSLIDTLDYIQAVAPGCRMGITFPHPVGAAQSKEIVPKLSDIRPVIQAALKKYAYLINTHYLPKCMIYPYQTITNVIDDEDMGDYTKLGIDYHNQAWGEVDYGVYTGTKILQDTQVEDIREVRVKTPNCCQCKFDAECIGIMKEYAYLYPNLTADLTPVKPY